MRSRNASCLLAGDFRKMQFIDHSSLDMFPIMFLSSSLGSLHHESNIAGSCIPAGLRFRGAIMVRWPFCDAVGVFAMPAFRLSITQPRALAGDKNNQFRNRDRKRVVYGKRVSRRKKTG